MVTDADVIVVGIGPGGEYVADSMAEAGIDVEQGGAQSIG
jgi:choline dehydrogenase-like flavoprotein